MVDVQCGQSPPMHQDGQLVTLKFSVPYATQWGEFVVICGGRGLLGGGDVDKGVKMECGQQGVQGLVWEATMTVPALYEFSYTYKVVNEHAGGIVVAEEVEEHSICIPACASGSIICVQDSFQAAGDVENIFKTAAFQRVIFGGREEVQGQLAPVQESQSGCVTVRFSIRVYAVTNMQTVYVYGNIAELGNWQEALAVEMTETSGHVWACDVTVPATAFPFSYRYVICDASSRQSGEGDIVEESGEPRPASLPACTPSEALPMASMLNDGHFKHKSLWRGTGLVVPVFSLRTKASLGCGEFMDCKKMVDFVSQCGIRVLQVLPVNDTTVYGMWWDSYPYSSLSVFALHPLYLSLQTVLGKSEPAPRIQTLLDKARSDVMESACVDMDYEKTLHHKLHISRCIFDSELGDRDVASPEFQSWVATNDWLKPYAAFKFIQNLFGTANHADWGCMGADTDERVQSITDPSQEWHQTIVYTYWLQWHLHKQLLHVSEYAAQARVVLKGDLPIGIDKKSVDTWVNPHLFRMRVGVGSPPDAFDPNGQNWGFPSYNWDEMAKDGYQWWRKRLTHMAQYFSAFRVDHILGFFRIYEVPDIHITGALGHFRPSHPIWKCDLDAHGLWDIDRLCQPYITMELVKQHLGAIADDVAAKYLEVGTPGRYNFKAQWKNEKEIAAISTRDDSPQWLIEEIDATKCGLMRLRQNVILLQDADDPTCFYPRFELMKTSSFKTFDQSKHDLLSKLHYDYFYGNQDELWRSNAQKSIPALMHATDMLMCGEDLGFVPACVPPVMHELGVIGLRIQRMVGDESPSGAEFGDPSCYSYLTVASPSCHDTTTTRTWYEEDAGRRERFYYRCLEGAGNVPEKCSPAIMHAVARQHMASPAILCILPVQDWLALSSRYTDRPAQEETINDPTNAKHYWRWRMHHLLDDILNDSSLIGCIQELHSSYGRTTQLSV